MKHSIRQYYVASLIIFFAALLLTSCTPAGDGDSATGAQPGQSLGIASIPNLRDLGGYETRDGKTVKHGLLYRSNQLSGITPEDMQKLAALRLQGAYDLRMWMPPVTTAELTGLQVGGISALALLNRGFQICLDRPATGLKRMVVSAGQRGVNLGLAPADFLQVTAGTVVDAT